MKIYSLIKKAINLSIIKCLGKKCFILPNLYLFNLESSDLKNVKKILFYFDSNEYMHLGDHLFFLPLVNSFICSGYIVEVAPTIIMRPVFELLNIPVVNGEYNLNNYDLIISRIEIVRGISKYKSLLVNVSNKLERPICDQLLSDFGRFFSLKPALPIDYTVFKDDAILSKLHLPKDKKLVIFNLYCDSAAYLINRNKINLLLNEISKYINNKEYRLVFTGSAADVKDDRRRFDFEYLDIRGKTSVLDIMALVNCSNAFCYIGFDGFIMHVFSLLSKPSFVVFRGRIRKRQNEMLKKFHVNLFNNDNFVTLLN